jgi:PA14 domain
MNWLMLRWRRLSVGGKSASACGLVLLTSSLVWCAVTRDPEQLLVSGAVVIVGKAQTVPPGVIVISQPTDFGGPRADGLNMLRGLVFFVPNGTSSLLATHALRPVAALHATRLEISPRSWQNGFPGVAGGRNEWFQIDYEGEFVTSHDGAHRFELVSDDGARLFIDELPVIDNDGLHPPRSVQGIAALRPGRHSIRVGYFQGPRYEIALQVFVTPPHGARRLLDVSRVL